MSSTTSRSVVIVGGGVFGSSTAYHLAKRGYTNVTILDRFEAPSKDSAGTDLNKVIRTDYPNPLYAQLAKEAMSNWTDPAHPFLSGMFRRSGWIIGAHEATLPWLNGTYELAKKMGRKGVEFLTASQIHKKWPVLSGPFEDWTSIVSPEAGWVPSGQALLRMNQAAQKLGVKYLAGDAGHVRRLVYDSSTTTCIGATTADGTTHYADLVVLANGANLPLLLPDGGKETEAQCSAICVLQLTPEEAERYKDIPIVEDFEMGIMFPPDESGLIKLCSCRSLTNYRSKLAPGASVNHSLGDYPYDGCPVELESEMRQFLADIAPELQDRPFVHTKMCWDALSGDLNFRICPYPATKNLYVATVGSNHGFKFLPVIGQYVADMLDGTLGQEWLDLWSWKDGKVPDDHKNPHPFPVRDLADLTGWQNKYSLGGGKLPWTWSRL